MRILLFLGLLSLTAALSLAKDEQIFISGGPSLRTYERHKPAPHDRFWGNFITSGMARYKEISNEIGEDTFTWLIFRPSYDRRSKEIGCDLIHEIKTMLKPTGALIVWFHDKDELINYLNQGNDRSKNKISRLEYFGHSNRRNWCFDYSNQIDGMVMENMCLHIKDLQKIKRSIFTRDAYTRSWGCHSGEEYSQVWYQATGVHMWGAIGKTNYSGGGVPLLSTSEGKWTQ